MVSELSERNHRATYPSCERTLKGCEDFEFLAPFQGAQSVNRSPGVAHALLA